MKIKYTPAKDGQDRLTFGDLTHGETFVFLSDPDEPMICAVIKGKHFPICLASGCWWDDPENVQDDPVRRLDATLCINAEEP